MPNFKVLFEWSNPCIFYNTFSQEHLWTAISVIYRVWKGKKTTHKSSKVMTVKKVSPSLKVIGTTSIEEFCLFNVITRGHYFSYKFIAAWSFFQPCCSVCWNKCFEGSPYFKSVISTITLPKARKKVAVYYSCQIFINNFIFH